MVLLGLLGVTFNIGSRSTQRGIFNTTGSQMRWIFRGPTEVPLHGCTKINPSPPTMLERTSTSPGSTPHTTVSTMGAPSLRLNDKGLEGKGILPGMSLDAALNHHANSGVGVWSQGALDGEATQGASRPLAPIERTSDSSTRSLLKTWKAGSGNTTSLGQVHMRVGVSMCEIRPQIQR